MQAVKHVNQSNAPAVSTMISGGSGKHNIVNMWISHYNQLLNSSNNNNLHSELNWKNLRLSKDTLFTPNQIKEAVLFLI